MERETERRFRAWYTHGIFECTMTELKEQAEKIGVKFADPDNPTSEELAKVYKETFAEMSDPWEVTANGKCKVEEIKT